MILVDPNNRGTRDLFADHDLASCSGKMQAADVGDQPKTCGVGEARESRVQLRDQTFKAGLEVRDSSHSIAVSGIG